MQDYLQAAQERHSVRAYLPKPISAEHRDALYKIIEECNTESGMHFQLVTDDPDTFGKSRLAKYGKFEHADNYIAVVGESGRDIDAGYYGEKIVLAAQNLGLNTCWVGLTFKKGLIKATVSSYEKVYALIVVGYGANSGFQHKSKAPEKIMDGYSTAPEWARRGVDCALLAPTALNQQKFRFSLVGEDAVKARQGFGFYTGLDLGIAKFHFEVGAFPHSFKWV